MNDLEKRVGDLENKIAVLTSILEERLGIQIDLRSDVDKFLDDFMDHYSELLK